MPAEGTGRKTVPSRPALLRVAHTAAVAGGRRTLEWYGRRIRPETKEDGSPVTPADRASEREIRRVIRRNFPTHTIVGEEGGVTTGDPRIRWIIDPIDGTKSFIHGVPLYAVLVAVVVEGTPVVGVVHMPVLDETIEAAVGGGCRWNGRRARVSAVDRLSEATILTTSARALHSRGVSVERIAGAAETMRSWGDSYGHALVATGRAEAMVDPYLKLWDVAPLFPILREAGGRLTDWRGVPNPESSDFVSSNDRLHQAVLDLLRPA